MRFEIYDSVVKQNIRKRNRFYVNGEGQFFIDCDPNGVDMSGKRTVIGTNSKRYEIKVENSDNAQHTIPAEVRSKIAAITDEIEHGFTGWYQPVAATSGIVIPLTSSYLLFRLESEMIKPLELFTMDYSNNRNLGVIANKVDEVISEVNNMVSQKPTANTSYTAALWRELMRTCPDSKGSALRHSIVITQSRLNAAIKKLQHCV